MTGSEGSSSDSKQYLYHQKLKDSIWSVNIPLNNQKDKKNKKPMRFHEVLHFRMWSTISKCTNTSTSYTNLKGIFEFQTWGPVWLYHLKDIPPGLSKVHTIEQIKPARLCLFLESISRSPFRPHSPKPDLPSAHLLKVKRRSLRYCKDFEA